PGTQSPLAGSINIGIVGSRVSIKGDLHSAPRRPTRNGREIAFQIGARSADRVVIAQVRRQAAATSTVDLVTSHAYRGRAAGRCRRYPEEEQGVRTVNRHA